MKRQLPMTRMKGNKMRQQQKRQQQQRQQQQRQAAAAEETKKVKKEVEAATAAATSDKKEAEDKDEEILALVQERKTVKKEEKERIREVSEKIQTCIREEKRIGKKRKLKRFQKNSQGTNNISNIKSAKKRILIQKVKNMKGEVITTRKGIANVFAKFSTELYEDGEAEATTREKEAEVCSESERKMPVKFESIPDFTTSEIQDAIDRFKKVKSRKQQWIQSRTEKMLRRNEREDKADLQQGNAPQFLHT